VIERILRATRTIAVIGASSKPDRPSNQVFRYLQRAGYRAIPVNPNEDEVRGEKAYPSLEAVPEPVDLVDVFRRPEYTAEVAHAAVAIQAKTFWLQLGVSNDQAADIAEQGGLTVVMDRCIAVVHSQLGLPAS
jgi:predicted CoA-binding protein